MSFDTPSKDGRVIEPAPPYRGEGPHALWHVSEDPTIYRLPERTFARWDRFWISDAAVEPLDAGIRLEADPELLALGDRVVAWTLDFSGIRLRNARLNA